ncbi:MAG: CDGSH iron-sulfur domain-containing protein [Kordiimonadaceae bacterium]|jgi:CDGSH-type Zn-finger protein|nr:CDGSH iron-sulfur domain-containing protein [Kordiimonadaceae bacterium]MBT6033214.1 CDGSH iron-sulfur domain-containing protein [Kordiimonadaceae bacterium]
MSGWQGTPFKVEVKSGEVKAFCMCGLSKSGPFCDGSHKGSGEKPEVIKFDADRSIMVCGCRQSKRRPLCDGSHNSL